MEATDISGRLVQTLLRLAGRPGRLSVDFVENSGPGQTHPVRLFLVAATVLFLATQSGWGILYVLTFSRASEVVGREWAAWLTLAVTIPFGAAVLAALFGRSRPRVLTHLIFALHVASVLCIIAALESLLRPLFYGQGDAYFAGAAAAVAVGHTFAAMRTFYREHWAMIIGKGLVGMLIYLLALFAATAPFLD